MPAFQEAVRVGADYIEVDVRTTSDGKLVLMHDDRVNRMTNGQGEVAKMTFEEIRALDVHGAKVPTFDEVLDFARGKINVYVDVKQVSAKDLVEHITSHGMAGNVVIYTNRIAKEIQELDPRLKIMPEARSAEVAQKLVDELHPKVLAFDAGDFKPDVVAVAKKGNALVYVDRLGLADNPVAWQAAIDAGADGIQTDHPEALVKYLREKGYRVH
jgi:glycerophosphoryl diester phosphodiesterase